jgi:hypothetical protein
MKSIVRAACARSEGWAARRARASSKFLGGSGLKPESTSPQVYSPRVQRMKPVWVSPPFVTTRP